MKVSKKLQRIIAILLCMIMVILTVPCSAMADEPKEKEKEEKTVRVGWFDSALCYYDSFGRRCGIDYEYQQKISAYTGWNYEYVEDSWPNLLQKLKDGEIDLLARLALAEKHRCRCVLETKTVEALRRSVKWLKARNIM